jgi:hypothetical protein
MDDLAKIADAVKKDWQENVAAIWARLHDDRADDAMELARQFTTDKQRDEAVAELRQEEA